MLWEIHLAGQSSRITLYLSKAIRIMICVWVWILERANRLSYGPMAEASTIYGYKFCQVKELGMVGKVAKTTSAKVTMKAIR